MTHSELKRRFYLLACFAFLMLQQVVAQTVPESIEVTFNKTTTVVFATNIASVDRGSRDVLVQKAKGVSNVLQLKAARVNFEDTNLTVITSDGQLHHYFVRYAKEPSAYTVVAGEVVDDKSRRVTFSEGATITALETSAKSILDSASKRVTRKTTQHGMTLSIGGIYVKGDVMFFDLRIANRSNIPFFTDMLQFSVVDRQKVRRTAFQQVVKLPLYQSASCERVDGQKSMELVVAFPAFTIPDAKVFKIELLERESGRQLKLLLKNRMLVKAAKL